MRIPVLLAATVTLAAGCAATMPNAVTAQHSANGAYYCWEDKLVQNGDRLECNWNADAQDACDEHVSSYISRSSIRGEPHHLRRCGNGQGLTAVTTR